MRELILNPLDYKGGVAVWYAMNPTLTNSESIYEDAGVHIHARKNVRKDIDASFDVVHFPLPNRFHSHPLVTNGIFTVTSEMMSHFRIAEAFGNYLTTERCPHCNQYHFDKDWFAAKPHEIHLCEHCGKKFRSSQPSVSNPAVLLRSLFFQDLHNGAESKIPKRVFKLDTSKFDSYELWGTCTGVLWTMVRPEDRGIHLHCYKDGKRVVDETFGEVTVDGVLVDNSMAQIILPQRQVQDISKWLGVITCSNCGTPVFHNSLKPVKYSECKNCEHTWFHRKVISNPILELV